MSPEKHGAGVEQARQMLETFVSLGADSFDLTRTDLDGGKQCFRGAQRWEPLRRWMPCLLESAITCQHNVIVRPRGACVELVQLDDLSGAVLDRLWGAAFLILATSPSNHQAWVAVPESTADWVRRLRRGSGADASASGAVRIAGSVNFKRKYAPDFPTVCLLKMTPNRITSPAELEALGLVAAATVPPARAGRPPGRAKAWPSYERCLRNAPLAHNGDRPDVSRADFTFCLLAIDWGWSVPETCEYLLAKSSKACAQGEAYARRTAHRAAAAVARRPGAR